MLSDTIKLQPPEDVPEGGGSTVKKEEDPVKTEAVDNTAQAQTQPANESATNANAKNNFPPPKTDKPRPHVCGTCQRSFARLEHLKRHERSHTKEKPFECPECTRCFARRDLLLRHQQKLHLTTTPSSRPRNGRRESTSNSAHGVGKARKGSMVQHGGSASTRPRANTISHVDGATLGMIAAANSSARRSPNRLGHSTHPSLNGFDLKPIPQGHHRHHGLPKIDTNGLNIDIEAGLRTAPAFGGFTPDIDMNSFLFTGQNTINPAQLHFADSPQSMAFEPPVSPFGHGFGHVPSLDDDANFEWINGFNDQMTFDPSNEHAIAGSSPSVISTGSPGGVSEVMLDGSQVHQSQEQWQNTLQSEAPMMSYLPMDLTGSGFPDVFHDSMSPKGMDFGLNDNVFASPKLFNVHAPTPFPGAIPNNMFQMRPQSDSPLTAPSLSGSSNRQSSVASSATDTITDATRQALIAIVSQPGPFSHRKYSQPTVSSPLSPGFQKCRNGNNVNLPSTHDFQRYIAAYIKFFHPRLPFLHIPTLSFDSPGYASHARISAAHPGFSASGAGDGGCLILSMAAIGALFEFDYAVSRELFDAAKKLISIFLEERRRADMSAAINLAVNNSEGAASNTPLWLVQSMLLNVVYGHNCGDRTSADIASTHCAALVSLARAAGLAKPLDVAQAGLDDIQMANDGWNSQHNTNEEPAWFNWKAAEERKRTLYSIFVLSSMLVSSYNFPPCLTNSEIRLHLPCDEDLWAADSAATWGALGGATGAKSKNTSFAQALSALLTASQRHSVQPHELQASSRPTDDRLSSPNLPEPAFHASDFGCLVLIIALHNYIWETRQRHLGRQWTHQETEAMQAHIGPALLAYQAVWCEPLHRNIQRPNPYGVSDLSADCVPWLDLAYVRLFVSLGRSKECFWHRDWDGMAHEIARGCEIVQHAEDLPGHNSPVNSLIDSSSPEVQLHNEEFGNGGRSSKRERHLRKAASHAAHSLAMADKYNVSLADFPTREMSIGSAMCSNDCAQVIAEWISTVQERIGPYVGVLGRDNIDLEGVPAIMLLEQEDIALLSKINDFVTSMEIKLASQAHTAHANPLDDNHVALDLGNAGLASKLLSVAARMCEMGGTWSVMHLMARSLESQAEFMKMRAEKSLVKDEPEQS